MGDVKRWSVTYTKHIKQKRKVYQDGFLELHDSSHKIMLYDDCEKLLHSRVVKKDDVVRSGETLAFDAYLVDIGDLDGDHKPMRTLNFEGSDKKITRKAGLFHGKKFKDHSVSVDRKTNSGKNKAPSSNLSPSQKVIREFKKNEMSKYGGAPRNCPDTTKPSYTEWQVLYTTHITQKAKKYHDGILRVATCGSQGRQVTLYDVSRRLLDSRFLKKDEVIGSGESLAFDGHLVDIGEPEGDHKSHMDLKAQGTNCFAGGKTGLSHGQQAWNNSFVEWHALYTTQITQKGKKYHSGILRLASCGSYQKQVTLLNEDGTILSRKFLKLSEDVRSGSTFELSNYLVEVGEPVTSPEGEQPKNVLPGKDVESNFSPCSVGNFKLGRRIPIDKPIRNANEILSILKKPMIQEVSVPIKSVSVEHCHASQSSDFIQFDLQNQVERHLEQDSNCERGKADNHEEETTKRHNPELLYNDATIEIVKSADSENVGESQHKNFTSSSFSLGSGASEFSCSNPDAECTDNSILMSVSSIEEPQAKFDCPDDFQPPTTSIPHDGSDRNMEGHSLELLSSKAASNCHSDRFSEELNTGTSPQPNEESTEIPSRFHEEAFACGIANSSGCVSDDPSGIRRQSSEVYKSTMDEIPSFDLGF